MAFVGIGTIGAPHGVHGEVRVRVETDFPQRFQVGATFTARLGDSMRRVQVEAVRWHKQMCLLKLDGINDRNAAEGLRGAELVVPRDEAMPLPAGSYYIFQLQGMDVFDTNGRHLGILTDVLTPGGNDVYVVACPTGEILLPAVRHVIREVDVTGRKMVVDPPAE